MSKISQIHDELVSRLASLFPTHKKLTNPYDPEDNSDLYLTKGYGVAVGAGTRTDRLVSCRASWERSFTILLTRKFSTTELDLSGSYDIQKAILEDQYTLFKNLESVDLTTGVIRSQVQSDGGIEFVSSERARYYLISVELITEYFEDVSA